MGSHSASPFLCPNHVAEVTGVRRHDNCDARYESKRGPVTRLGPMTSEPTSPQTQAFSVIDDGMNFHTRKWVKPEDLNANSTLFGGALLRWVDEEAAIYAILQMGNHRAVTKMMSEINFISSAVQGDMIEMGLKATRFGRTSLTMRAEVRNMITRNLILSIDKIVFVSLDAHGNPQPHGYDDITYNRDRLPTR